MVKVQFQANRSANLFLGMLSLRRDASKHIGDIEFKPRRIERNHPALVGRRLDGAVVGPTMVDETAPRGHYDQIVNEGGIAEITRELP